MKLFYLSLAVLIFLGIACQKEVVSNLDETTKSEINDSDKHHKWQMWRTETFETKDEGFNRNLIGMFNDKILLRKGYSENGLSHTLLCLNNTGEILWQTEKGYHDFKVGSAFQPITMVTHTTSFQNWMTNI